MTTIREIKDAKSIWATFDAMGRGNYKAATMLTVKKVLVESKLTFDHGHVNDVIRRRFHFEADQHDLMLDALQRCANKGHDWRVRSQAAFDAGYDEPVVCTCCGQWDM